jgi:hypothetical protein
MIVVLNPVPESDMPILVGIFNAAFTSDPMMAKRYPNGMSDKVLAELVAEHTEASRDPSCHYIAAMDTETGQIISFARWNEYFNGRPDEEWQKPIEKEEGEGTAVRYGNDFFSRLYEERRKRWRGGAVSCKSLLIRLGGSPLHSYGRS